MAISMRAAATALVLLAVGCATTPVFVARSGGETATLLLRDVRILDVQAGALGASADVLIEGGIISRIDASGSLVVPAGSRVLDGEGATLLPGLIDAHAHLNAHPAPTWDMGFPIPEQNLQTYLYSGVTTLLDPADGSGEAAARRDAIARGDTLGPRLYVAGHPLTTPGGHPMARIRIGAPWWLRSYIESISAREVASRDEALEAVALLAEEGVDFVKIMVDDIPVGAPVFEPEIVETLVAAAHDAGLRTLAHIGSTEEARLAGEAGIDAWVHGVYTERIPDAAIPELAGFGIPMVPTLVVFDSYSRVLDANRVPTRLEREIAPPELLESFDHPPSESPLLEPFGPWLDAIRAHRQSALDNVRRLHDAGVTILAGSDPQSGVFAGPGLHRELALLVKAGLSPGEAIRAATLDPARFLTRSEDPDYGIVAVGKRADLLLVEGNPLDDIGDLARIREVILGGVAIERRPLASQ